MGSYNIIFYDWFLSFTIIFSKIIHVVSSISTSTTFYCWVIFYYMTILLYLFIHQLIDVRLFLLLTILNNEANNIYVQVFLLKYILASLTYILENSIAGSYGNCLTFWETASSFSKWLHHFPFSLTVCEESNFCVFLPSLGTVFLTVAVLVGVNSCLIVVCIFGCARS